MEEIWKDIAGFEGKYQVSNLGRIKSLKRTCNSKNGKLRTVPENIRAQKITRIGYHNVNLYQSCKSSHLPVHRLVALAFIPNPENKPQVNHIDGVKTNNNVENLEWNTVSENKKHAFRTGLQKAKIGSNSPQSKLREDEVLTIKCMVDKNIPYSDISILFGISKATITGIKQMKTWRHLFMN